MAEEAIRVYVWFWSEVGVVRKNQGCMIMRVLVKLATGNAPKIETAWHKKKKPIIKGLIKLVGVSQDLCALMQLQVFFLPVGRGIVCPCALHLWEAGGARAREGDVMTGGRVRRPS